ncbi:hypothetical protein P4B35_03840 [Pontiellaceae bacterium B12227]|nr:hypothetical protein [Pontiellaceae bacterium B12227]
MKRLLFFSLLSWAAVQTCLSQTESVAPAKLLNLTFSGVSKLPLDPHIKNRSRLQLKLTECALAQGEADLALEYAEQIENWQRLVAFNLIAQFYIDSDQPGLGDPLIRRVENDLLQNAAYHDPALIVKPNNALMESLTDWRLEKVQAQLIDLQVQRGAIADFEDLENRVGDAEAARLRSAVAVQQAHDDFDSAIIALDIICANPNIEVVNSGILGLLNLYRDNKTHPERREQIAPRIESALPKLPVVWQFEVLMMYAAIYLDEARFSEAQRLLIRVDSMLSGIDYQPRYIIPIRCRLAAALHEAGLKETAWQQITDQLALYESKRDWIVNIDRAGLLCAVAEANFICGDEKQAEQLWIRAVSEGLVNPNSRPRAEALCDITCSVLSVNPNPGVLLFRELEEMNNQLGNPW